MKADIVQYSIDIRDREGLDKHTITKILEDAGLEVLGCEWQERWTSKEYGYDEED